MSGLSGSGKSTTAGQLVTAAGAVRLRSDAIRKHLAGIPLRKKGGDEIYTPAMSTATYSRLIDLGVQLASRGYRVVLDAKFDRSDKRAEAITAAKAKSIPLTFLYCTAPPDVLRARVEQREGDIADATAAVLARQSMDAFSAGEPVIELDTTQSAEAIESLLADVFSV